VEFRGYTPLLAIALVRVRYSDGRPETYSLPLVITLGEAGIGDSNDKTPENVLCRVRLPQRTGILSDALVDDKSCQTLLTVIKSGTEFGTRRGVIYVRPTGPFDQVYEALGSQPKVNRGEAHQSDTTVFFGGKLMLKAYRKLESGINPDIEVRRFLAEEAGFRQIPLVAGAIEYDRREAEIETLAMFQAAIETEDDGWTWTLDELARYYEYCASLAGKGDTSAVSQEALGISLNAIYTLARFTAKLHLALASSNINTAFAPEQLQAEDLNHLSQRCQRNMEAAFNLLERTTLDQSEDLARAAQKLISSKAFFLKRLHAFESSGIQAFKIRVHGNYHLGLVLRTKNDYVAIDFEGERARPLSERRAKTSPLKDVAGMLRSLSYAAQVGLVRHINRKAGEVQDLLGFARLWEQQISFQFLKTYCEAMTDARLLPAGNDLRTLLEIFILERALHELQYEINNRPQWIHIPLYGLLNILEERSVE
jgi:maltose alpha-D-glucosyltransferase/alpha-amylase